MTKNPISVNKDMLAIKSLAIMSENKITSLCVHKKQTEKNYRRVAYSFSSDGNIS